MGNRKNVLYTADDEKVYLCKNHSSYLTSLGFEESTSRLTTRRKPKRLEPRKIYVSGVSLKSGVKVERELLIGNIIEEIYRKGGVVTQRIQFPGGAEDVPLMVTARMGESRRFYVTGDPGGPAPAPETTAAEV